MGTHLNPLEKEVLIKRYQSKSGTNIDEFCLVNNISVSAFKTWLKRYSEEGVEGLVSRAKGSEVPSILPEGVEATNENLKREVMKLRIENERLKKNYTVRMTTDGKMEYRRLKERSSK